MMFDFVLDAHIINETTLSTILEYDTHTHTHIRSFRIRHRLVEVYLANPHGYFTDLTGEH